MENQISKMEKQANRQKIMEGVLCVVTCGSEILLIKRAKPPYVGLYSLPGGKIEFAEHPSKAALREVKEETGLDCKFEKLLGVLSEVLTNEKNEKKHFLMYVCELTALSRNFVQCDEGELRWVKESEWQAFKPHVIQSDWQIVKELLFEKHSKSELREVEMHVKQKNGKEEYAMKEYKAA
ncbi:MAG: NUDIX domain-containing protein [Candidatus Micrarchaeota archaeon]